MPNIVLVIFKIETTLCLFVKVFKMVHPVAQCLQNYMEVINDLLFHDLDVRYTPEVAELVVNHFTLYGRMLTMTHPRLTKTTPLLWHLYAKKVRKYWFELS